MWSDDALVRGINTGEQGVVRSQSHSSVAGNWRGRGSRAQEERKKGKHGEKYKVGKKTKKYVDVINVVFNFLEALVAVNVLFCLSTVNFCIIMVFPAFEEIVE